MKLHFLLNEQDLKAACGMVVGDSERKLWTTVPRYFWSVSEVERCRLCRWVIGVRAMKKTKARRP